MNALNITPPTTIPPKTVRRLFNFLSAIHTASASVMVSDIADLMDGPQRHTMLVLQRVIMLGELAVNRVRDNHRPG